MANPLTAFRAYIKESIAELKKVTWPSRELTVRFSALVIIVSAAFAGFFAALDYGLQQVVNEAFIPKAPVAQPLETPEIIPTLEDAEGNPLDVDIENPEEPQTLQVDNPEEGGLVLPPLELE